MKPDNIWVDDREGDSSFVTAEFKGFGTILMFLESMDNLEPYDIAWKRNYRGEISIEARPDEDDVLQEDPEDDLVELCVNAFKTLMMERL